MAVDSDLVVPPSGFTQPVGVVLSVIATVVVEKNSTRSSVAGVYEANVIAGDLVLAVAPLPVAATVIAIYSDDSLSAIRNPLWYTISVGTVPASR